MDDRYWQHGSILRRVWATGPALMIYIMAPLKVVAFFVSSWSVEILCSNSAKQIKEMCYIMDTLLIVQGVVVQLNTGVKILDTVWLEHNVGFYVGVCNGSGLPLSNGYILVEANGGLNQQRSTVYILFILSCMLKHVRQWVWKHKLICSESHLSWWLLCTISHIIRIMLMQICNAVAVAKLMNATLIIPLFHFNSVWKDPR